ncbi:hypothetical protein EPO05_01240 [Patescibacteria group bacterium]|nr:MAG: hypothetical protein EPO05_01240 [Patescibacteria group bacterium]
MLEKELKKAGLTENEAKTYLAALELGETTISRIAKKSGIKRTTTYLAIDLLKEKGLISAIKKKDKAFFYAEDPRKILENIEETKREVEKSIPELLSLANLIDKKPKIRYFEGFDGLKEVYKDTLNTPGQEILLWASDDRIDYFDEEFVLDYYVTKRMANKIHMRVLAVESEFMSYQHSLDPQKLRQMRLIQPGQCIFSAEINLYGSNKIAIISHRESIGLIMESQKIFETLKGMFEVMWAGLPER